MSTSDKTYVVLPGANDNAGGRYEYLMTSYAALNLLQSSASNFQISLNSKKFGKFDDIVVEILQNGITTESWAVQLKHSTNKKAITTRELGAVKGDFSLNMYFEDYRQQQHMAKPILLTNKVFREGASIQIEGTPYVLTSRKSSAACPFNTSQDGGVFQFDIKVEAGQAAGDDDVFKSWQTFLDTFCICANQNSVDQLDQEVSRLFATALGFVEDERYKKFFEKYWGKKPVNGKKDKLFREEIEREVARIVLGPYARPTIASKVSSAEENMLKTIISQFDVTLIDANCDTLVANLWQLSDGDIPSIVTVSEAKADSIYNVLNVLKIGTYKFVLVGGDCLDPDQLTGWSTLENLSNLKSEHYKSITNTFSCVVQGRKKTCLAEILKDNEKLNEIIKIGHLLRMADDNKPFVIGDETVKLPAPYIDRSVRKHVFSCDLIGNLTRDDVLVISCGNVNKLRKMVNEHKHDTTKIIDITNRDFVIEPAEPSPMILISRNKRPMREFSEICSKSEKNVLLLDFSDNSLNLLSSQGKLSHFKRFHEKDTDKTVNESEILTNFANKTNLLLADPGMGKTICGDFIKQICPFDAWPIKINLREKSSLFTVCTNVQDLLAKVLDTDRSNLIQRRFQEYYYNEKQLMLIWDGLDEVENENVDLVVSKVKEISRVTRHHQWITSRCHLQEKLQSFFNVFSITLTEVSSNDQRTYIENTLREIYHDTIADVIADIQGRIAKNNLKDMLSIPLLLNMFATICSKPDHYKKIRENDLSLAQIYGVFIDSKFDYHYKEKGPSSENSLLQKMHRKLVASHMTNYPKAALITCFGRDFLEKFNLNSDDFVQEIANTGDEFGLITTITDDNTPIFLHKTFAEYFAAMHLTKEYKKLGSEILNQLLFRPEHKNIRFLFDLCLSENLPAHQAVLAMNLDKLKEIAEKNKDVILSQDKGGRNVLHLACSYGTSRMPLVSLSPADLKSRLSTDEYEKIPFDHKTFDATPLHFPEKENKDYENMIKYLVSVADQKIINDTDKIYGLNCVGYADASLSLYAIESLFKICKVENIQHFLRNYKDTETLFAYSIVLNYENLSTVFDHIPYFELFRENTNDKTELRQVGFDEDLSYYNMLILIIEFGGIDLLRKALKNVESVKRMKDRTHQLRTATTTIYEIDPLIWAVKKGETDIFNLLLQHEPDLKRQYGSKGDTILHIAVELRQRNIVKHIVDQKLIEIEIWNQAKETPLLLAVKSGVLDIVIHLIAAGAKVDVTNVNEENVLHLACKEGDFPMVHYLVTNHKILLEQLDKNQLTPLLSAAEGRCYPIVLYLKENGANFKAIDKDGRNLLHVACLRNDLPFIKRLTKENVNELDTKDCNGNTPLTLAAFWKRSDIFEYLFENNTKFIGTREKGRNILHCACFAGDLLLIQSLTTEDLVEFDTQDCDGLTPLLIAAFRNHFDVVKYLLKNHASFKATDKDGHNLLHFACFNGNLAFIRNLTKTNLIELDAKDCDGDTPLLIAANQNHFDVVKYLLENDAASFKATNKNGQNLLHFAVSESDLQFIQNLTKKTLIELDTQDCDGNTPLLLAAGKNHFDIVKYLLENDASFKTTNENGQNLLHYACLEGNLRFIQGLTTKNLIELDTENCKGDTPLLRAAYKNHFDIVKYLLENGASFKTTTKNGQNLLHYACFLGNLQFIQSLTKKNLIELDTEDCNGCTPLLLAAGNNHIDIVQYLLENDASFKATTKNSQNLLHIACSKGDLQFIQNLIKKTLIELDTQGCNGNTPLLLAAGNNHFGIVKYLLENDASFKATTINGLNLLHYACSEGDLQFIQSLTKKNLIELDTEDCKGDTPLLLAAGKNHFDIVKHLLENDASFKATTKNGQNLLHYACFLGNLQFIQSLTKKNLIELDIENCKGDTPLLLAAFKDHFDIVQYLLENDASFKATTKNGQNLLHFACSKGDLQFTQNLTKKTLIELDTQDCDGCTPLLLAANQNHFDIVRFLLENGASFQATNKNGENVLHFACFKGDFQFIQSLTKKYISELDTEDCNGYTPLLLAAGNNHFDIVQYLLEENGASFKATGGNGKNLLHFACSEGDLQFIQSLTKKNLIELDNEDYNGDTPLLLAAGKNHFDIVKYLLENDASFKATTKNGKNLLHHACFEGNLQFIRSLTKKTLIELDTQDCDGNTPLMLAIGENHFYIAKCLLENDASFKATTKNGQNLLHGACFLGDLQFIQNLTKKTLIELDTQDCDGNTPLLLAAYKNHFDISNYLLENDASFKATTKNGQNLLHYACFEGNLQFIQNLTKKTLIELDTQDCDGNTPLLLAAYKIHFDIVKYLLENDASFKTTNIDGQNLFHFACFDGDLRFIQSQTKKNLIELDTENCKGDTPLLLAAYKNHFDIVKYLLENGASFKATNKNGQNVLHFACFKGDLQFIQSLTKKNLIELDTKDCNGYNTPLLLAAGNNHFDIVQYLLENAASFKATGGNGKNVLHYACFEGNLRFIQSLTKKILIELDTEDRNGDTPLLLAVGKNHFDIAKYLLENDASFKATTIDGQNLLHYACFLGDLQFIQSLTKKNLIELDTENCKGDTPLLLAAFKNHFDIVKYLLENDASFKATTKNGQNLLHYACSAGDLQFIQNLIKKTLIELDTQDCNGCTPLLLAVGKNHFDISKYLLENDASFKATTKNGQNLLHYACFLGDLQFIQSLTKKNLIELDTESCKGDTPLLLAAFKNHFDIVKYLLENDASFKATNKNGKNLLHFACLEGNLPFIQSLTKRNLIELDTQDCDGCTPLLLAANQNHFDIVRFLLENGASFQATNKNGENVLHFACFKGDFQFIQSLTKKYISELDTEDCNGYTPLLLAAGNNHFDIVQYLLENAASFKATGGNGKNVLHHACFEGNLRFIQSLTKKNLIELDTEDRNGDTPLLLAVGKNHFDISKYLLENDASFKATTKNGQNLLHYACSAGDLQFIQNLTKKTLIELDTQDCNGCTPLLLAADKNHFDIVNHLLENDTSFKAINKNGKNLLHFACLEGNLPFIQSLTQRNLIELDTQDCDGCTPLLLAANQNHFDIVNFLLKNEANFKVTTENKNNILHLAAQHGVGIEYFKSCLKPEDWNALLDLDR